MVAGRPFGRGRACSSFNLSIAELVQAGVGAEGKVVEKLLAEKGDPGAGIAAGTKWEDVPLSWRCPDCGAGKEDFEMVEV